MSDDNNETDGAQGPDENGPDEKGLDGNGPDENAPDASDSDEKGRRRERVIGTPSPAQEKALLAEDDISAPAGVGEQLDEASMKRAERIVATLFLVAFAASVAFIAYFIGWSGRDG